MSFSVPGYLYIMFTDCYEYYGKDFYKLGDISINPEISGTGFKIKMIESLSYGKPTICSESSLRGMKKESNMTSRFLIANNADEYVDCITFLSNYENYKEMQQIGIEYLNKIRHKTSFDLNAAIEYLSHDK